MASVSRDPNGTRRVLFVDADGSRKALRLGKCDQRTAERICGRVEDLLAAKLLGQPVPQDTASWLAGVGATLRRRMENAGLLEPAEKAKAPKIGELVDGYLDRRPMKENTRERWKHSRDSMVLFFGLDRPINEITAGDAADYEAWLHTPAARQKRSSERGRDEGLLESTLRKRIADAKQIFRYAVDHEWIDRNPFQSLKGKAPPNRERDFFVTPEIAKQVLEACASTEWRLIFALARFGGLRVPSEIAELTWQDVNWEKSTILIRSPKTGDRLIPLFHELRPYLNAAWDEAPEGASKLFPGKQHSANLRTQLHRIIVRAGLKPWPKTFHALRASRATELHQRHPAHVVYKWLGHTEMVAQQHYLQTTEEDFQKAAQNPAQQAQELGRTDRQTRSNEVAHTLKMPEKSHPCEPVPVHKYPLGWSNTPQNPEGLKRFQESGAESGARGADSDADLRRVVEAWGALSEAQRRRVLAIVEGVGR